MTDLELEKLMKVIAKNNGITVEQLKKEVQSTIDAAYINPTEAAKAVPSSGAVPTIKEFMQYLQQMVSNEK